MADKADKADKAIFLDRDDTLVEDTGYINHPDQVRLLAGVGQALTDLRKMGYKLVVVSNQSGVARGIVTEEVLEAIHQRFRALLGQEGAFVDGIYYCPYHPDGVIPKYRLDSELRKPKPGMFLKAARDLDIDLSQSWAVGNSYSDVEAGMRAGCRTILIDSPLKPAKKGPTDPSPDKKAVNIREAVNIIKMYQRKEAWEVQCRQMQDSDTQGQQAGAEAAQSGLAGAVVETAVETVGSGEAVGTVVAAAGTGKDMDLKVQKDIHNSLPQAVGVGVETHGDRTEPARGKAGAEKEDDTHQMVGEILGHLKSRQRLDMFDEFSTTKLLALIAQMVVGICLVISVCLWMYPKGSGESVLILTGYAIVFQLMTIAFYLMRNRR